MYVLAFIFNDKSVNMTIFNQSSATVLYIRLVFKASYIEWRYFSEIIYKHDGKVI